MAFGNAYNVYKSNSVNYASREQLLLMLLDGAVKFSKIARQAIIDKDIVKAHTNIVKTEDIFCELRATLDTSLGVAWIDNLSRIYQFIIDNLVKANVKKDLKTLDETIVLIENVRDTWYEAYKLSKTEK